jgi:NTE family protein
VTRALVLGGGGLTGLAWEAGVLRGLAESGVDVERWDRVVGTSAGAFVGAHVAAGALDDLYFAQRSLALDDAVRILTGRTGAAVLRAGRRRPLRWVPGTWLATRAARALATERWRRRRSVAEPPSLPWGPAAPADRRLARIGSIALAANTPAQDQFLAIVERVMGSIVEWPPGLVVTAVDAHDGALICFDETSGVPLIDAVAASGALPVLFPPVTIGGRAFIDGGMRSDTNIALAGQMAEVLALVPIDHGRLEAEAAPLRAGGTKVRLIVPGSKTRRILGADLQMLDPDRRVAAAEVGREQGRRFGRTWRAA